MKMKVLAIDIGGTNLRGAVINQEGSFLKRDKINSMAKAGIDKLINNLIQFINSFNNYKFDAIGLGIPGIIDKESGIITQAPNIAGVSNFPLIDTLKEKIDVPIIIENDACAAAVGEHWLGSAKGTNSMIMLTLGTGLGGGIIINGDLWRGENGMAGEIGHTIVDINGPSCNCGNNGCLESFVSGEALRRIVSENNDLKKTLVNTKLEDIPEALKILAEEGNNNAKQIWAKFGKYLGIGISSIINLLNVEMIVIGGGISNAWNLFIDQTNDEIRIRSLKGPINNLKINKANLGDDSGVVGISKLSFNYLEKNLVN